MRACGLNMGYSFMSTLLEFSIKFNIYLLLSSSHGVLVFVTIVVVVVVAELLLANV